MPRSDLAAAGGRAINGKNRILELQPESLHEKTPFFIESEEDVLLLEKFLNEAKEENKIHIEDEEFNL